MVHDNPMRARIYKDLDYPDRAFPWIVEIPGFISLCNPSWEFAYKLAYKIITYIRDMMAVFWKLELMI